MPVPTAIFLLNIPSKYQITLRSPKVNCPIYNSKIQVDNIGVAFRPTLQNKASADPEVTYNILDIESEVPIIHCSLKKFPSTMEGWTPLTEDEYDAVWDRFYDQFAFRPSVSAEEWPSIREPTPSVTFRFTYDDAREDETYESWVLTRLRDATEPKSAIYALDWQHESFWFYPHEAMEFQVPPFPDGDYYIFLTQDFSTGLFGHPWEQTICIFGDCFLAGSRENLPRVLSTVHRTSGVEGTLGREQGGADQRTARRE